MKKILTFAKNHKITSVVILIIIVIIGYWGYGKAYGSSAQTKYILYTVQKGSVITNVTGTGQVSANNQIDIQSKVSGDITNIYVKPGQEVKAGTLIAHVDSTDASLTLQSSQIAYEKLVEPPKPLDVTSAQNSVNAAYNDAWNAISSTFIDYPTLITGMDNLFYSTGGYLNDGGSIQRSGVSRSYIEKAGQSYDQAKNQYETVLQEYNSLSRSGATSSINLLVNDTGKMVKAMTDSLKNTQNAVSFIMQNESDSSAGATTAASNVNSWSSTISGHSSSIISAQNSIVTNENALSKLMSGADPLDVQAQKISLQKNQNAYSDYFIRAPFDGIIAKVPVSVGNPAGSATIATIITNQKIAEISLNEVDVAKIKLGDKVNLTFDAIDGLNITGQVDEIDLVGTASQGVVNYNIKIGFDTQDNRVKSGMSVNASIITDSRQDVLIAPSSSVKSQSGTYYVDYFDQKYTGTQAAAGVVSATAPLQKQVEVGLSDDTNIEIVSGLNEGDQIVSKTVNQTTAASAAPSIFNAAGSRTGGGGNTLRRIGG